MWDICRVYVGYMYIQVHMGSMPGKEEEGGTDAVADSANRKIQLMVDAPIYDNSSKLKSLKKALKICEYCIVHLKERFEGMFCTLFKPLLWTNG